MLFRQLTQLDPDYYLVLITFPVSNFRISYLLLLIVAGDHIDDHLDDLDVGALVRALLLLMVIDELLLLGLLDLPPVGLVPLLLLLVRPPQVGV